MKNLLLFVCLLTFAGLGICSSLCLEKNKFLSQLASASPIPVEIYSTPNSTAPESSSHCGSEWKDHGTCCNPNDLLYFFNHEIKMIENDFHQKRQRMIRTQDLIEKLNPTSENSLKKDSLFNDTMKEKYFGYNKCEKALLSIRGPALCSVCSGRSEIFFNDKKDKLLIDLASCKNVIETCKPAFETHHYMIQMLDGATKQSSASNSQDKANLLSQIGKLRAEMMELAPPQHLMDAFKKISFRDTNKEELDRKSIEACSLLIDIMKKPIAKDNTWYVVDQEFEMAMDLQLSKKFPTAFKLKVEFDNDAKDLLKQRHNKVLLARAKKPKNLLELEKAYASEWENAMFLREKKLVADFKVLMSQDAKLYLIMRRFIHGLEEKHKSIIKRSKNNVLNGASRHVIFNTTSLNTTKPIKITLPGSRSLGIFPSGLGLELADSMILLKVPEEEILDTLAENPTAFVVGQGAIYQPANLSLAFP